MNAPHRRFRAFTMVELLVVIGLIAALIAILVPALFAAQGAGARVESMNNLRQIGEWMTLYSQENRQFIVPSRFDYSNDPYPGKTRSQTPPPDQYKGTWTDILWTLYAKTSFPTLASDGNINHAYEFDSPDRTLYDVVPDYDENPFRSTKVMERGDEDGYPGYFAANDFFNADAGDVTRPANWWTIGQITQPDRSLYAIDSVAGEVIAPEPGIWGFDPNDSTPQPDVDYRYEGEALILFLDGHVDGEGEIYVDMPPPPTDLDILEEKRNVRVRNLHQRPR